MTQELPCYCTETFFPCKFCFYGSTVDEEGTPIRPPWEVVGRPELAALFGRLPNVPL